MRTNAASTDQAQGVTPAQPSFLERSPVELRKLSREERSIHQAQTHSRPSLERQLFSNQLWETVAFIAKAAFMLGLTPWMIHVWGAQGYGEFALASSLFILLSFFDLGIRGQTRVALSAAAGNAETDGMDRILTQSVSTFLGVSFCLLVAAAVTTIGHYGSRLLGIRFEHESLVLVTVLLTVPFILSTILLELLVARGRIGAVKFAAAIGWLAAMPTVAILLWLKQSVIWVVAAWLLCLLIANAGVLLCSGHSRVLLRIRITTSLREIAGTVRDSRWFSITTLTWAGKTHGVTLLLSVLAGPATAGIFFLVLRLSEIISALGAISFDVALAAFPQCRSHLERRDCLVRTSRHAFLFSSPCVAAMVFFAPVFFQRWLSISPPLGWSTGIWISLLGLSIAANRLITYSALGLNCGRVSGICGLIEMILTLGGASASYPLLGLKATIVVIIVSVAAQIPALVMVVRFTSPGTKIGSGARMQTAVVVS